jgi:proteasome beta subunit
MTLPIYRADDDPGPSFVDLLQRVGAGPRWESAEGPDRRPADITHGTTVVALRCSDGVVMAGDRRATSGNLISHRTMEKVFAADRHSGIAFAGAAGPAMEMVKLFQLQLEHYEKVEGGELSLDGKANQLSQMVRGHMPAAMQGLVVVPLFAGFDLRRNIGRLFEYDVTGGRYEESDFAATGSGSLHAGTVIKLGHRDGLAVDDAVELAINALFQAADEDSATGGPDLVRGIFPMVAVITADGFQRLDGDDVAARFRTLLDHLATARGTTSLGTPGVDGSAGSDGAGHGGDGDGGGRSATTTKGGSPR